MENKKLFAEPVCEVTHFEVEDIVATSTIRTNWDTDDIDFISTPEKVQ